jgi:hypothetical protein
MKGNKHSAQPRPPRYGDAGASAKPPPRPPKPPPLRPRRRGRAAFNDKERAKWSSLHSGTGCGQQKCAGCGGIGDVPLFVELCEAVAAGHPGPNRNPLPPQHHPPPLRFRMTATTFALLRSRAHKQLKLHVNLWIVQR